MSKYFFAVCTAASLSGCMSMFSNLRQPIEDSRGEEPVHGGIYWEKDELGAQRKVASTNLEADSDALNPSRETRVNSGAMSAVNTARPIKRVTRNDFVDQTQEGSLWTSDGQTNYYLTKNKVRTLGDLVAIKSNDALISDVASEIKRTLTPEEKEYELSAFEQELRMKIAGVSGAGAAPADKDPAKAAAAPETARAPSSIYTLSKSDRKKMDDVDLPAVRWEDVDLGPALQIKPGEIVMAEVTKRYPNGNYKIQGVKKVRFRNSLKEIRVVAIAKPSDISDDDQIEAGKLYEYRLDGSQ